MKKVTILLIALTFIVLVPFQSFSSMFPPEDLKLAPEQGQVVKDTLKPKTGDWVSLHMLYTTKIKGVDTILYNSKVILKGAPLVTQLPPSEFKGDLFENIRSLSRGDSITFQINADSLFLRTFRMPQRPPFIDSNSVVTFHVTLLSTDSPEDMKNREEVNLKKYLEENKITVQPRASGIYFIETIQGSGLKVDTGCMVKLNLRVSLIDGKLLFNSADRPEPIKFRYGKRFDTRGVDEGIGLMKSGGKATIVVPSKMAFGEQGKGAVVPPYSALVYEVEIVNVQSKADYDKEQAELKLKEAQQKEAAQKEEAQQLQKYLMDNKITVKPTPSGLFYIEKVKGTGPQPVRGDRVSVHYTGTLLNGKKFDSSFDRNVPFGFNLGKGQVIKGWDEGIAMMRQGGKAILIVPSNIAYGERSMGEIPPFATLVFEVELLEVKPGVTK